MRIVHAVFPIVVAWAVVAMLSPAPDAAAHDRPAAQGIEEPAVVAALRANGARIMALGDRGGLSGHFVELADGDAYGLYLTPDGHAVAGLLYGPDGILITGSQIAAARSAVGDDVVPGRSALGIAGNGEAPASALRHGDEVVPARPALGASENDEALAADPTVLAHGYEYGPDVPGTDAPGTEVPGTEVPGAEAPGIEMLFERSGAAFGFTLGRSGPLVVLFADPACRWSRAAVARLGRPALDGRLRLHVVPVGVLGAASAREAAAIASAPDPALAWFEGAGASARPEGGRQIARNNDLFDGWGLGAVPLIVWRGADGRIAHRLGDLDDLGAWLEALPHE